ncbi:MAG: hypothetical protein E4H44_04460 [Candidatus Aminicenantes bacterium]|nr:MAG: hypothetical protein E4H44_04460 [Candidatus Aminicenantes bacterium]
MKEAAMRYARAVGLVFVIGSVAAFAKGSARGIPLESGPSAHQQILQDADGFRLESDGEVVRIADLTSYCVGCHPENGDGSDEPSGTVSVHTNHPVDVPYPEGNPHYVPTTDLDPKLRLVEGNLSCITCHDPQAADRALVLRLEEGELCLACHRN